MTLSKLSSKRITIPVLVVVIIFGGVAVLHMRSVHKAQHTSGVIPNSKKDASASKSKTKNATGSQNSGSSPSDKTQASGSPTGTTSSTLIAPFGTFISNHKPGQNGSPTSEQSVCNTTPGATCDIQFVNGSVSKSLGAQVANSNGTAYWSWDINGGTLAPGSWRVTAVVKLNGQTKTTSDPTLLEVR